MIVENYTRAKDYLTKSKLKTLDYVINPFVGCPINCAYCYAAYMASFSKHKEEWGEFIDIKQTSKSINLLKIKNKKVMISTVTDPYNSYEEKYLITRKIMTQLVPSKAFITIVTKSKLVLRDIDLFKKMKHIEIALSFSTLDEKHSKNLEPFATSVEERLETLKILKENNIRTVVFVAPVIPQITNFKRIIEETQEYADEYWFDMLTLRNNFQTKMFNYINKEFPLLKPLYKEIYTKKDYTYLNLLSKEITDYCVENGIVFKNFYAGT